MKNALLFAFSLLAVSLTSYGQYHRFSNPITAPLHFNPAFAGSVDEYRVAMAYRNQFINGASFMTMYGSYDQLSNRLKGAIGFEFYNDMSNYRLMRDTRFSATYAGKIKLGGNWTFSPALKVSYQHWRILQFYKYDFPDDLGETYESGLYRNGINFSPAVLVNTPNFYLGFSADQLASVLLTEFRSTNGLRLVPDRIWKTQAGYRFQPGNSEKWSLAVSGLAVMGKVFGKQYREVQGQLMYNRRWFMLGAGINYNSRIVSTGPEYPRTQTPGWCYQASLGFKHRFFRLMGVFNTNARQGDLSLMLYLPRKKATTSPESSGM